MFSSSSSPRRMFGWDDGKEGKKNLINHNVGSEKNICETSHEWKIMESKNHASRDVEKLISI